MQIHIERNQLMDALNICSRAVPSKTPSNILKCLLVDAESDEIHIIGNDNELGIQTDADGTIEEHGVIAIPADVFSNIVRKLPDGQVSIQTEGEKVCIQCNKVKFNILGMEGTDFSYLPEVTREHEIVLTQFTLKDIIAKTIFSISANESNRLMTGEYFEIHDHMLRVSSLDGHRISARRVELKDSYDNCSCIIPGKALSEVSKILSGDMEKTVRFTFSDKHAMFEFDRTTVVTRLIEGTYFNVDSMLSSEYKTRVHLSKEDLLLCLERSVLMVREEDKKPVILSIGPEEMEIRINSALGSFDEFITIGREGEDLLIAFNPKFMIDALRSISDEEVDLYFMSQRSPAFIRDDNTYCYLILPVNFISSN